MLQPNILRVLVADDHPIVRMGLATLFGASADMDMVGEATNGQEAVEMCTLLLPDVVLMDLNMPVMNGTDATRIIYQQHPGIVVIMFSGSAELAHVPAAIKEGARAFLRKSAALAEIILLIRIVANHYDN